MLRVPLATFIGFMLAAGEARIDETKSFKAQTKGNPKIVDFYAPLRDAIFTAHVRGEAAGAELEQLEQLGDARKRAIFPGLVKGYRAFLEGARPRPSAPPRCAFPLGGLELDVDPELEVEVEGRPTLLKIWWLGEPLTDKRARLTCGLMTAALGSDHPNLSFAMLDLPRGRLVRPARPASPHLPALAAAEAGAFLALHDAI